MSTHPEDLALVARIVGGDETAADEFAREYLPRFKHLAHRAGVPRQDCEDVAQEVFLAAFSQMQRGLFRGESSLATWLDRILRGMIANYWRTRPAEMVESDLEDQNDSERVHPRRTLSTYHTREIDSALITTVRETLRAMPAPYRAILLLKRSAGCTLAEIARALQLTIGQVSSRLYTSEEMFRRILRGDPLAPRQQLLLA